MKKCKSCQKEIDNKATKCPFCQSDQRNWFRKHPILTVILGLMFIGIVGSSNSNKNSNTTPSTSNTEQRSKEAQVEPEKPKEWVTVVELKGGKTRLTYDVKGNSVVTAIYVLKEGASLEKNGGVPEVMISEAGTDTTFLAKGAGTYYLDVSSANSSWTVKIEEER